MEKIISPEDLFHISVIDVSCIASLKFGMSVSSWKNVMLQETIGFSQTQRMGIFIMIRFFF